MKAWLWPLPPPGPITFAMSWEKFHVAEVTVVADADELAASQAE